MVEKGVVDIVERVKSPGEQSRTTKIYCSRILNG